MKKQNIIGLSALLVILVIFWGVFYSLEKLFIKPEEGTKEGIEVPFSELKPGQKLEEGLPTEKFEIFGGEGIYPRFFKDVSFKPYGVSTGDTQIFSIWVEDSAGVEKVKAEIETDLGAKNIDLKLIEGNNKKGLWQGSWHVCGFQKEDYYKIIFRAQSSEGKENIFTTFIENIFYKKTE